MKKKNLVTLVVTLALVAIVGLGSTIAFLATKADDVKNTFTFSTHDIKITLDEAPVVSDNKGGYVKDTTRKDRVYGNTYSNVLPGAKLFKDPKVTVLKNSVDCYVFVSVTNANGSNLIIDGISSAWKEIILPEGATGAAGTKYYVYVGDEEGAVDPAIVVDKEDDQPLTPVFTQVIVSPKLSSTASFSDIVLRAAAVQYANNNYTDAEKEALILLGVEYVESGSAAE